MAGFHRDDVAEDFDTGEHQVADEIERLVAGELVGEAHGLLRHDFVAADDHGAFQRAAFDQSLVEQRLDVLVINEGAGGADFVLVGRWIDLAGEILGEASFRADVGDGDFEGLARDDGDDGAVAGFQMDRLADFPDLARRVLGERADLFDQLHEGPGGAVADRRFVGVHLDERVVHAHAG